MLLGLRSVVTAAQLHVGRFYLAATYRNQSKLFQVVDRGEAANEGERYLALIFAVGAKSELSIEALDGRGPYAELPDVHVRIDPPSISGNAFSMTWTRGMFAVVGNEAFVAAPHGYAHWTTVNISTGMASSFQREINWLSFSRWSLVVEEAGQEITIASFGESSGL